MRIKGCVKLSSTPWYNKVWLQLSQEKDQDTEFDANREISNIRHHIFHLGFIIDSRQGKRNGKIWKIKTLYSEKVLSTTIALCKNCI